MGPCGDGDERGNCCGRWRRRGCRGTPLRAARDRQPGRAGDAADQRRARVERRGPRRRCARSRCTPRSTARAMFVREADEAVLIGPDDPDVTSGAADPYLDLRRAARAPCAPAAPTPCGRAGASCQREGRVRRGCAATSGIVFVGPSPEVMRAARRQDRLQAARRGGRRADGGVERRAGRRPRRGPRRTPRRSATRSWSRPPRAAAAAASGSVERPEDLDEAFDARLLRGRARPRATPPSSWSARSRGGRHVEVQVVADATGDVWTLGVRDCSRAAAQPEGARGVGLHRAGRRAGAAAAHARPPRWPRAAGYVNAGTVEFLYEPRERLLSFLEVNTRLQVEHPVTEATTGVDIVKLQLHVAMRRASWPRSPRPTPARARARDRGPADRRGPRAGLRPRARLIEHLVLPGGPGRARRHRRGGGRRDPAPVRLDDRQGHRVGPRPRRGPRAAWPARCARPPR